MKKYKKLDYMYSTSSDILEIRIKNLNKTIYKVSCPVDDKKNINRILKELDMKGFIDLKEAIKKDVEKKWF